LTQSLSGQGGGILRGRSFKESKASLFALLRPPPLDAWQVAWGGYTDIQIFTQCVRSNACRARLFGAINETIEAVGGAVNHEVSASGAGVVKNKTCKIVNRAGKTCTL